MSKGEGWEEWERLRKGIDGIDRALVVLLAERCRVARELQRQKANAWVPACDPAREHQVLEGVLALAKEHDAYDADTIRAIWGAIFQAARGPSPEPA